MQRGKATLSSSRTSKAEDMRPFLRSPRALIPRQLSPAVFPEAITVPPLWAKPSSNVPTASGSLPTPPRTTVFLPCSFSGFKSASFTSSKVMWLSVKAWTQPWASGSP